MLLLALVALLAAQNSTPPPDDNVVAPLVIEGRKVPEVPTDLEITDGLNDLLKTQPDRVVCLERKPTGSRIPRMECDSLRGWYRWQASVGAREGAREDVPPTELVAAVQAQYARKAQEIRALKDAQAQAAKR